MNTKEIIKLDFQQQETEFVKNEMGNFVAHIPNIELFSMSDFTVLAWNFEKKFPKSQPYLNFDFEIVHYKPLLNISIAYVKI